MRDSHRGRDRQLGNIGEQKRVDRSPSPSDIMWNLNRLARELQEEVNQPLLYDKTSHPETLIGDLDRLIAKYQQALIEKDKLSNSQSNFGRENSSTDQYSRILKTLPGLIDARAQEISGLIQEQKGLPPTQVTNLIAQIKSKIALLQTPDLSRGIAGAMSNDVSEIKAGTVEENQTPAVHRGMQARAYQELSGAVTHVPGSTSLAMQKLNMTVPEDKAAEIAKQIAVSLQGPVTTNNLEKSIAIILDSDSAPGHDELLDLFFSNFNGGINPQFIAEEIKRYISPADQNEPQLLEHIDNVAQIFAQANIVNELAHPDQDSDASDSDTEETETVLNEKAGLTQELIDLVRLTNHYRNLAYLSLHSNREFSRREEYAREYQKLHGQLMSYVQNESSPNSLNKVLENNAPGLPADKAAFLTDYSKLEGEIKSESRPSPQEIYNFGTEFKFIDAKEINQTVSNIIFKGQDLKGVDAETSAALSSSRPDQARVTQFRLDKGSAVSVESWRMKKDSNGNEVKADPHFISQSYFSCEVTDKDELMAWACITINRFFAAAPKDTRKFKFEDGYQPEQLAALISYCHFMGYDFAMGKKQILRIMMHEAKTCPPELKQDEFEAIKGYKDFKLNESHIKLAKSDRRSWDAWATSGVNQEFNDKKWQKFLDKIKPRGPVWIPPLGKAEHAELLKRNYLAMKPQASPAASSVSSPYTRPALTRAGSGALFAEQDRTQSDESGPSLENLGQKRKL